MKAILICPGESSESAFFRQTVPLALCPILGRTALDRTLADLAKRGATEVTLLAADRPHLVREAVHDGKAWGFKHIEVITVSRRPSIDEARKLIKSDGWLPAPHDVSLVTPWPDQPDVKWKDSALWFESLMTHLSDAGSNGVGMREVLPGVWIAINARVSSDAKLIAPCWIGQNTVISPNAIIGPRAVVESSAFIDEGVEIRDSFVGPATFAGAFIELRHSLAWGRHLLDWESSSLTEVTDAFLLGDMHRQRLRLNHGYWIGRLTAIAAMFLTIGILLVSWWRAGRKGLPMFTTRRVVRAPVSLDAAALNTTLCTQLNGVNGFWKRWPELWKIATGHFEWIGNRPLTPEQAADLKSEFERLWLSVPAGFISLADAVGCWEEPFGDEARAHAAYYAAHAGWRAEALVLGRWMKRAIGRRLPRFKFTSNRQPQTQPT